MKLFAATRSKRKFNNPVTFDEIAICVDVALGSERILGNSETIPLIHSSRKTRLQVTSFLAIRTYSKADFAGTT